MTPERLTQLVGFLDSLGLDAGAPGGPGLAAGSMAPIEEALSHSSLGEQLNHERLEFLGDAVLRLAATEFLRRHYPDLSVGEQSSLRSHLVSDRWLTALGDACQLAQVVRLGPMASGDKAGQATVLAESTEALIGAIYLAWGGLAPVISWLTPHWHHTSSTVLADPHRQNWKSSLQEWSQSQGLGLPSYLCREESLAHGDPKRFYCQVHIESANRLFQWNENPGGWGRSRREAQQSAARQALEWLQNLEES